MQAVEDRFKSQIVAASKVMADAADRGPPRATVLSSSRRIQAALSGSSSSSSRGRLAFGLRLKPIGGADANVAAYSGCVQYGYFTKQLLRSNEDLMSTYVEDLDLAIAKKARVFKKYKAAMNKINVSESMRDLSSANSSNLDAATEQSRVALNKPGSGFSFKLGLKIEKLIRDFVLANNYGALALADTQKNMSTANFKAKQRRPADCFSCYLRFLYKIGKLSLHQLMHPGATWKMVEDTSGLTAWKAHLDQDTPLSSSTKGGKFYGVTVFCAIVTRATLAVPQGIYRKWASDFDLPQEVESRGFPAWFQSQAQQFASDYAKGAKADGRDGFTRQSLLEARQMMSLCSVNWLKRFLVSYARTIVKDIRDKEASIGETLSMDPLVEALQAICATLLWLETHGQRVQFYVDFRLSELVNEANELNNREDRDAWLIRKRNGHAEKVDRGSRRSVYDNKTQNQLPISFQLSKYLRYLARRTEKFGGTRDHTSRDSSVPANHRKVFANFENTSGKVAFTGANFKAHLERVRVDFLQTLGLVNSPSQSLSVEGFTVDDLTYIQFLTIPSHARHVLITLEYKKWRLRTGKYSEDNLQYCDFIGSLAAANNTSPEMIENNYFVSRIVKHQYPTREADQWKEQHPIAECMYRATPTNKSIPSYWRYKPFLLGSDDVKDCRQYFVDETLDVRKELTRINSAESDEKLFASWRSNANESIEASEEEEEEVEEAREQGREDRKSISSSRKRRRRKDVINSMNYSFSSEDEESPSTPRFRLPPRSNTD